MAFCIVYACELVVTLKMSLEFPALATYIIRKRDANLVKGNIKMDVLTYIRMDSEP